MPKIVPLPTAQAPAEQPKERFSRRKDGLYQLELRYTLPDGSKKKKSFYGKTQAEAIEKRKEFERELALGINPDKATITVSRYIDQFLVAYKPTVKAKTYRQKVLDMEAIREQLGKKRIRDVVKSDVQIALNSREGMSTEYIKKLKVSLGQLFDAAYEDRIIPFSPCIKLRLPQGTSSPHRELTDEEKTLVRENTEHRFCVLVWVMMFAGLRPGEAVALRVEDVDFKLKQITVRDSIVFDGTKSETGDLKSEASYRSIPLVEPLCSALREKIGDREKGRVFLTVKKGGDMTQSSFKRGMQSYLYGLGMAKNGFRKRWTPEGKTFEPVHFAPYDLRHTFCSMLYDAGVDIKTAMLWMGHADAQVTLNIYTHLSRTRKQAATVDFQAFASTVGKSVGKSEKSTVVKLKK